MDRSYFEINLPSPRRATSLINLIFLQKNFLTNAPEWCFFPPVENENHGCSNPEACASQWMHVYLAAQSLWSWRRGDKILKKTADFSGNPRLPVSRGFPVF
jgi:hypothetical protein